MELFINSLRTSKMSNTEESREELPVDLGNDDNISTDTAAEGSIEPMSDPDPQVNFNLVTIEGSLELRNKERATSL